MGLQQLINEVLPIMHVEHIRDAVEDGPTGRGVERQEASCAAQSAPSICADN